ncbi:MAG TPA: restriction endonuclease [bacterium]|nr:restriction endonuclease [bacterium]
MLKDRRHRRRTRSTRFRRHTIIVVAIAMTGVVVFIAMRWAIPAAIASNPVAKPFAIALPRLAPISLMLFGLFAVASTLFEIKRRKQVDEQTSLESLRKTSWKDFEFLVAEAFRRQGFQTEYSLGRGADGGIDITLRKDGHKSVVQCKQWKIFSVGAPVIREMFGLMTAEKADEAIIVTTGNFTRDAQEFAAGKPIQLIDGSKLLALVKSVQIQRTLDVELDTSVPKCPICGKDMIERIAKRGSNTGSIFWGCSEYPKCKGTRAKHPVSLMP